MEHNCCGKQKVRRGLWSPEEDEKLIQHINSSTSGHGSWSSVPKITGLQRCGKSCRLRWINYLRPDLKRGSFSEQEERIIIDLHRVLGNRWAQIAKQMPGRTDNEVKNFWNSCIKKKLIAQGLDPNTHNLIIPISLPPPASNIIAFNCSPSQITHKPPTSSFFPTSDQHHSMLHDFQNHNWVWSTDQHLQLEQDSNAAGCLHAMKFGVSVVSSSQNSCPSVREIISENWKWGSSCLEEVLMGTAEKGKANCEVVEFEKGSTMVDTSGNNIHMDHGNSFGCCSNTDDHFDFGESTSVLCGMNYHPNPIMDQYGWS